ncbi:hypothetical protein ACI6Q2_23135 [Chitinophagaceae bacterium LWZ2-11]
MKTAHSATVSVNYGSKQEFLDLNDTTTLTDLDKVNNFTNDVDAINYMNKLGWACIRIIGLSQFRYECFFQKTYEITKP